MTPLSSLTNYITLSSKLYIYFKRPSGLLPGCQTLTHALAFPCLPTLHHIQTSKLIHGLKHTSYRKHLFYGTSNKCPIHNLEDLEEDSASHVLQCQHLLAAIHHDVALAVPICQWTTISTQAPVLDSILHGFSVWCTHHYTGWGRALVVGSLNPSDILLTSAFYEQYHHFQWCHLYMGQISI
jgi:hypothetical protein